MGVLREMARGGIDTATCHFNKLSYFVFSNIKDNTIINVAYNQRVGGSSTSKGCQCKWFDGKRFIKLDSLGYESMAEVISYWVSKYIYNFTKCVRYYPCTIVEDGIPIGTGCYSYSYLQSGYCEISFGKLLKQNLLEFSIHYDDLKDLLYDTYGDTFEKYIDDVLFLDILTRNNDRHFGNMSLLQSKCGIVQSPIYDNGCGFLSDVITFPIECSVEDCIRKAHSKPFTLDFTHPNKWINKYCIKYTELLDSLVYGDNAYFNRCIDVLKYTLNDTKDILWEEII